MGPDDSARSVPSALQAAPIRCGGTRFGKKRPAGDLMVANQPAKRAKVTDDSGFVGIFDVDLVYLNHNLITEYSRWLVQRWTSVHRHGRKPNVVRSC
jgi:hypothetical protein